MQQYCRVEALTTWDARRRHRLAQGWALGVCCCPAGLQGYACDSVVMGFQQSAGPSCHWPARDGPACCGARLLTCACCGELVPRWVLRSLQGACVKSGTDISCNQVAYNIAASSAMHARRACWRLIAALGSQFRGPQFIITDSKRCM